MGGIAVVTGANRGLGREVASRLAAEGFDTVLACRNVVEAGKAAASIREAAGRTPAVARLDLASLDSIQDFVEDFGRRFGRVGVLVNNAGVCRKEAGTTADGHEINVGTNYLGTFALTLGMVPFLDRSAEAGRGEPTASRVVNVASDIYRIGRFSSRRIEKYRWFRAYAVSKYLLVLFTRALAERGATSGIEADAVHPGVLKTDIMYASRWYDRVIDVLLAPHWTELGAGADAVVRVAIGKAGDAGKADATRPDLRGRYFSGLAEKPVPARYLDPAAARFAIAYGLEAIKGRPTLERGAAMLGLAPA